VQIVDAVSITETTISNVAIPASPSQSVTKCSGISGIYSAQYGLDCTTTNYSAVSPHQETRINGVYFLNGAKAILPDGEKVLLSCFPDIEKHCKLLAPEWASTEDLTPGEFDQRRIVTERRYFLPNSKFIGAYKAERTGDQLSIWGPRGKVEYHIIGQWSDAPASENVVMGDRSRAEGLTTVAQQLVELESKPLGITIVNPDPSKSPGKGVLVQDVASGSFASAIGLQKGDVILEINGQQVGGLADFKSVQLLFTSRVDLVFLVRKDTGLSIETVQLRGALP
ncbi:MAG: PDZ domain-containing protein, partial [Terracidiphilus sp.]